MVILTLSISQQLLYASPLSRTLEPYIYLLGCSAWVSNGYLRLTMTQIELLIKENFHLGKWYLFLILFFASLSTSN